MRVGWLQTVAHPHPYPVRPTSRPPYWWCCSVSRPPTSGSPQASSLLRWCRQRPPMTCIHAYAMPSLGNTSTDLQVCQHQFRQKPFIPFPLSVEKFKVLLTAWCICWPCSSSRWGSSIWSAIFSGRDCVLQMAPSSPLSQIATVVSSSTAILSVLWCSTSVHLTTLTWRWVTCQRSIARQEMGIPQQHGWDGLLTREVQLCQGGGRVCWDHHQQGRDQSTRYLQRILNFPTPIVGVNNVAQHMGGKV